MKLRIRYLLMFYKKLGFFPALKLYTALLFKNYNNITLPNIKTKILLRKETSDLEAFLQVFFSNGYDINFKEKPKVIIDGGANIGLFSLLMKNRFPDSRIISIEPDLENYIQLQKNISCYEDVFCERAGLWDKKTKLKIDHNFNNGKWGIVVKEDKDGDIDAISIDDLILKYSLLRIDLLKLDIETSEKIVFSNNYEKWLPKAKMIIIELHDWLIGGCSKAFFTAINKSIHNYRFQMRGEHVVIINNDI